MKNKNKIKEGALDVGIQSYPTSQPNNSQGSSNGKSNVNIKKKDLSDPKVQKDISNMKNVNVNVVEEELGIKPRKFEYLSEIKDSETGEFSKPFTIAGKNYQMIRALSPDKQKVMAVYSLDETDDDGDNMIYDINEFETNIAKKAVDEEGVVEPEGPEASTLNTEDNVIDAPADEVNPQSKADEISNPSFAGFKHFIVNKKSGKARKFKGFEDLAKAQMGEDEQYMGIKDFKKYVDETLFGTSKRAMKEDDTVQQSVTPVQGKLMASAQKLMDIIKSKLQPDTIKNIQQNPLAQEQVILAFAAEIGVPANKLTNIITGIKGMAKQPSATQPTTTTQQTSTVQQTVSERRIIKVKDLK